MSERPPSTTNALVGGALIATAGIIVLRFVGPVRVLAIVFLGMGVFYLNRTDPKRLTAVLIVVGLGLAWLAYRTASQRL